MTISTREGTAAARSVRHTVRPSCVADVMSAPGATVRPTSTYLEVVSVMLTADVGGLPVVDTDGRLVGVVTAPDLITAEGLTAWEGSPLGGLAGMLLGRDADWLLRSADRAIADVMTRKVVTVTPDTPLEQAAELMWTSDHRRLPVVRDGVLVGLLSDRDLRDAGAGWTS